MGCAGRVVAGDRRAARDRAAVAGSRGRHRARVRRRRADQRGQLRPRRGRRPGRRPWLSRDRPRSRRAHVLPRQRARRAHGPAPVGQAVRAGRRRRALARARRVPGWDPRALVLGISLAGGDGVSVGLLAAIFISNLPEAVGSATEMRAAGRTPGTIMRVWILVAAICALASVIGFGIADNVSGDFLAAVDGFAAGALLVMLIDSMIPEAARAAATSPAWSPCSASPSPPASPASASDRPAAQPGAAVPALASRQRRARGPRAQTARAGRAPSATPGLRRSHRPQERTRPARARPTTATTSARRSSR